MDDVDRLYSRYGSYLEDKKMSKKYDCLLSACYIQENFFYKNKPINFKPYPWPKSQDLKGLISLPFVISILKRRNLERRGSLVGNKPFFYIMIK